MWNPRLLGQPSRATSRIDDTEAVRCMDRGCQRAVRQPLSNAWASLYGRKQRELEEVGQMEDRDSTSPRGVFWTWIGVIGIGLLVMIILPLTGR